MTECIAFCMHDEAAIGPLLPVATCSCGTFASNLNGRGSRYPSWVLKSAKTVRERRRSPHFDLLCFSQCH